MGLASVPMYRCRVKTAASFPANDPWNEDRATHFTLEDYVRSEHARVDPDYRPPGRDFERALKSGIDGRERILPDSLSELWRAGKIPATQLPRLLKAMEPTLDNSDYPVLINNKVRTFLAGVLCFIYALTLLLLVWSLRDGSLNVGWGMLFLSIMTLFCGGLYYFVILRTSRRRRSQMRWLLDQVSPGS